MTNASEALTTSDKTPIHTLERGRAGATAKLSMGGWSKGALSIRRVDRNRHLLGPDAEIGNLAVPVEMEGCKVVVIRVRDSEAQCPLTALRLLFHQFDGLN